MEKDFWQGVRDALPTALGYISIGLACGVVASPYLSPLEMALMSILVYAGAAQFAMISLIAAHSSILNMALTVFLINLRNMLMSLHTSSDFKDASLAHTIGIGSLLTDESYGVYLSEKLKTDRITVPWMHGNNLVGYVAWDFRSPVSRYATDRKDQDPALGALSSSSEFLSLPLFCFATACCSSCDLDWLFCGGDL